MNIRNLRSALTRKQEPEPKKKGASWIEGGTRWYGMNSLIGQGDDSAIDNNTIVWAHNNWLRRALGEPGTPKVFTTDSDGKPKLVPGHLFADFLAYPQNGLDGAPGHTGKQILGAVARDLQNDGNALVHKVRAGRRVGWLEYIPLGCWEVVSRNGAGNILDRYRIWNNGVSQDVPPEDVIHFRQGVDPSNVLLGCSGLKTAMRLVMADNEMPVYWHAIMKMPMPTWFISAGDSETVLDDDFQADIEAQFNRTGGEGRGKAIAVSGNAKAEKLSFSPEELVLDKFNRIPEYRLSAIFGVAAIVIGLAAGQDTAKFANWKEAREQATEEVLVPLWQDIAETLTISLFPEFGASRGEYVAFDLTGIRSLQEDRNALAERTALLFQANLITRAMGLADMGYPVDESRDNVFYSETTGAGTPQDQAVKQLLRKMKERQARNRQVSEAMRDAG